MPAIVSVRGVLWRKGAGGKREFLILRRSENVKRNKGLWQLIGGKVELGEKLKQAYLRECKEEINRRSRLADLTYAGAHIYRTSDSKSDSKLIIHHLLVEEAKRSFRVKLSREHQSHAWVSLDDLGRYELTPETKVLIQNALTHLETTLV